MVIFLPKVHSSSNFSHQFMLIYSISCNTCTHRTKNTVSGINQKRVVLSVQNCFRFYCNAEATIFLLARLFSCFVCTGFYVMFVMVLTGLLLECPKQWFKIILLLKLSELFCLHLLQDYFSHYI